LAPYSTAGLVSWQDTVLASSHAAALYTLQGVRPSSAWWGLSCV
jgi:hypothetical protein